jgi:hypothetical protein
MIRVLSIAAAIVVAPMSASAWVDKAPAIDRGAIGRDILQVCVASPMGQRVTTPEVGCACVVGVVSARSTDRQFYIFGRLAPFIMTEGDVSALDQELQSEGFTESEFNDAAAVVEDATAITDSTCWPLRR